MAIYTCILLSVLLVFISASETPANESGRLEDGYFKADDNCNKDGGICILTSLCPETKLSSKGSCRWEGSSCCHGLPKNETRCEKLGGQCKDRCGDIVVEERAKDCQIPQKCCILI